MMIELKKMYDEVEDPNYATEGSVGIDLKAITFNGNVVDSYLIAPNETVMVGTGIKLNMTAHSEDEDEFSLGAVVLPRSGLGSKHGIVLGNLVGLIDNDYQGEITICLWNRSDFRYTVNRFDRVAQLSFIPFFKPAISFVKEFSSSTARGEGGFGSTGKG